MWLLNLCKSAIVRGLQDTLDTSLVLSANMRLARSDAKLASDCLKLFGNMANLASALTSIQPVNFRDL